MIGSLLRAVLLIVVLVAAGAFLLGWWGSGRLTGGEVRDTVGTTGAAAEQKAREVGARVGETAAVAAEQGRRAVQYGTITAKIKAKMALDDTVKALDIDVDTNGTTVTVSGVVANDAQRQRALQLARETEGVREVIDHLRIRQ
jgi:osmotically-inducible protein OsmY